MRPTVLSALLALALLPVTSTAGHCATWSNEDVDLDTNPYGVPGVKRLYVVDDGEYPLCEFLCLWIYEETNGIDGLQRGDEVVDNTCHGMIQPDSIYL